ncbi:unnamed protein product, partial [Brenthis ino]
MKPLWPKEKPVPDAKLNDLKSVPHLFPQDSHDFYVRLVGNDAIEDDLEALYQCANARKLLKIVGVRALASPATGSRFHYSHYFCL